MQSVFVAGATEAGLTRLDVGGPEVFTQAEIARMAVAALGRPARVTHLPDALCKAALALLPRLTPRRIHGPAQFLLTALALDMVGDAHGARRLSDHFKTLTGPAQPADTEGVFQ